MITKNLLLRAFFCSFILITSTSSAAVIYPSIIDTSNIGSDYFGPRSSCMRSGPNSARVFVFQAISHNIYAALEVGSLKRCYLSLWDSTTELQCRGYRENHLNLSITYNQLIPGKQYKIVVDVANVGNSVGTFRLLMDTILRNDFKEGAIHVNHKDSGLHFNSFDFSADGDKASCWTTGPNYNHWYKFVATTKQLQVDLISRGIEKPFMALYGKDGTELACERFFGQEYNITLIFNDLEQGESYFLSVDNSTQKRYQGFYELILDTVVIPSLDAGYALALNEELELNYEVSYNSLIFHLQDDCFVETASGIVIIDEINKKDLNDEYFRLVCLNEGEKEWSNWVYIPYRESESYLFYTISGQLLFKGKTSEFIGSGYQGTFVKRGKVNSSLIIL